MSLLEVNHLQKIYMSRFSASTVEALKDISFTVEERSFTAVMGESGSGKTTLLNILATLDKPSHGEVRINGKKTTDLRGKELSDFRRNHLGFVFQDFNLLSSFNNQDNILLPLVLNGQSWKQMQPKLKSAAAKLGIDGILHKFPYEISGGQKQRVAAARALITEPELILADEPTGALDSRSAQDLMELFERLNQMGQTIVMVTHSIKAASYANRVLFIKDGEIYHQIYRGEQTKEEFFNKISETLTLMSSSRETMDV